jgi:hypothetical protein
VAHFKALFQHLTGGTSNVNLGIAIKAKLSQGLINHALRSGDIASPFLTLALHRDVVSFMPQPFYPQYPLYKRLGGSQSQSECYGEKNNHLSLPGIKPQFLGRPVLMIVTILTELSRLICNTDCIK